MLKIDDINILRMVFGIAFLRPLLNDVNADIDQGIIVLLDSGAQARAWALECEHRMDAKLITELGKSDARNYQAGVHVLKNCDTVDAVEDFLSERKFLPILAVGGILPFSLREDHYIIRLRDIKNISEFSDDYEYFCKFCIANAGFIENIIKNYVNKKELTAFLTFETIGLVWDNYYYNTQRKECSKDFWKKYRQDISRFMESQEDYEDCYDVEDEIRSLVWKFLEQSTVQTCAVESVSREMYQAVRDNKAILYDDEYYYFSERLVKKMVQPLMDTMSIGELKKLLKDQDIIICNGAGYTIKKRFTTVFGYYDRMRAIKIRKNTLMSDEGLLLEDCYEYKPSDDEF
ncbi:hypothetical protein [Blautia sp. HCP3S3_C4]|uniref:hypothetical protein n=1 Tax=Blautia sp. HCP3S3_C4 TaxID=3438911 RepID=UPI003F89CA30